MQPAIPDDLIIAVVTGCQRGERAAVEQLYDLYADRLYRYFLVRVGQADTAADLTTELFLRVIEHIGSFRLDRQHAAATVSAWLYRIAANLIAGHYRAQRRTLWVSLEELWLRPTAEPGPERRAEQDEAWADLAQAMTTLSEDQRLVLTGKFVEAMSNADIAAWLGKTEGAIKSLQHRALRTLAQRLHAEEKRPRLQ